VLNTVIAFLAPPPKIGRKKFGGGFSGGFSASRIFFGGFSVGPNFSAAAAKFGG